MADIDELIVTNKGLAYKQLHRFYLINDPEAESAAFWALYQAIITYDASKNVLLSTYATCCIYNALGCYVRTLKKKRQLEVMSYDVKSVDNHEMSDVFSSGVSSEDQVLQAELILKTREAIQVVLDKTTNETHKKIMSTYIANDYDITTLRVAEVVGVSQSYVSQVLSTFRNSVKKEMEGYYYA